MDAYAKSATRKACARCEELFDVMEELDVRRNVYTFSALQNVIARSGSSKAPSKTMAILDRMMDLHKSGDVLAKPNTLNYNVRAIGASVSIDHSLTLVDRLY